MYIIIVLLIKMYIVYLIHFNVQIQNSLESQFFEGLVELI